MVTQITSGCIFGVECRMVRVEIDVSNGLPMFEMVGRLSGEVKEAAKRVRVALKNEDITIPPQRITVNLAPADVPKEGAKEAIRGMKEAGVRSVMMLTGDSEKAASAVAAELGITDYRAELLPQDKVNVVEELLNGLRSRAGQGDRADKRRGRLAFIGDGINDAPVLSVADVGIAMGSMGSDAAIEAADVVIMDDELGRIPSVMSIARKTLMISKQNIAFALFVKFSCLVLGALGIANMWMAVFADVGVAVICILNSMRMLKK